MVGGGVKEEWFRNFVSLTETYLLSKHKGHNLQNVHAEVSLILRAGNVQQQVFHAADMDRP